MALTPVVRRKACCTLSTALSLGLTVLIAAPLPAIAAQSQAYGAARLVPATAPQSLAATSLPWVANAGQWDARAAFRAQSFAGAVWVTQDGALVHQFNGMKRTESSKPTTARGDGSPARGERLEPRNPGWVLTERFVGGAIKQAPRGSDPQLGQVSFMTHDRAVQAGNVPSYGQVELGEVFPGVAVALKATNANVEKLFTVAPGRDPGVIRIAVDGAERLSIGSDGRLIATTGNGDIAFTAPVAFQETANGVREPVQVAYALDAPFQHYGFALGSYDPTRPLVIDPLLASTYLGGSDYEQISAIAIHPHSGEVYVAGWTQSASFPAATGGAQPSATGTSCFVSRYSADLSRLVQSSYFGNGYVRCTSLAFNPSGDAVYVAGSAHSTSTLPSTSGAIQAAHANATGSGFDGFVARLSIDLRALTKATYFGGAGFDDRIDAIAVHPMTGFVHVVGTTNSSTLPGTAVGTQPTRAGDRDAFIARLPADLLDAGPAAVRYTFIGGTNTDSGSALAIDSRSGDVFVAGQTSGGLPIAMLAGAAQPVYVGTGDAFIARLKQDLSSVVRATYFGGGGNDLASSLAMHPLTGEVVVAGSSESAAPGALPNVAGGAQSANGGGKDGFVSRLSADLTAIGQTTYFGGAGIECPANCTVAIHPQSGEVLVAGSTTAVLPAALVANGYQAAYVGGAEDAFVLRFNAALTQIRGGTHLGGSAADPAVALAIDPTGGSVYVAGVTDSANFPTVNPQQGTNAGGGDAFVSRFATDLAAVNRIPNPFSFIPQSNVPPNTIRTSNEVRLVITPAPPNNQQAAYVTGAGGSELCIATQPGVCVTPYVGCASPCYSTGWFEGPWDFLSGDYIAVRHISANPSGTAETKLIISGQAYPFRTSTGNATIACNLDMNGDNALSATLEGLILVRAMLGFDASAIIAGTGVSAWNPVRDRLNQFCGTNFP
ncbi:MAG: hypothetical protein JNL19_09750 [Burkholderiales bacterium]|nr:hypothetical protein [Burkholderiales bacterium]